MKNFCRIVGLFLAIVTLLLLTACGDSYVAPEGSGTHPLNKDHIELSADMDYDEDDYGTICKLSFSAESEGHEVYAYLQCQVKVTWTCQLMNQNGDYEPFVHSEILTLDANGNAECDSEADVLAWDCIDMQYFYEPLAGNVSVKQSQ